MEVKAIVKEIQRLSLTKRFWVMEQTLKSIIKEELINQKDSVLDDEKDLTFSALSVNERSLAKDWLSAEDNRWDKIL